jgi:lipoate-protein ligase A
LLVQEKVPGGKLLCVDAEFTLGRISRIRITGDFFLHPEEALDDIEKALVGIRPEEAAARVSETLARRHAIFIGASADDIGRLVRRAAI